MLKFNEIFTICFFKMSSVFLLQTSHGPVNFGTALYHSVTLKIISRRLKIVVFKMSREYLLKYFPVYCAEAKINNEFMKDLSNIG